MVFVLFGLFFSKANAAVVVNNFSLGEKSITFDISGSLPNDLPRDVRDTIFFVNRNTAADPGFALGNFLGTRDIFFTGTQRLSGRFPVSTGNPDAGDYFYVSFSRLSRGEFIDGTLTATWGNTAFDPTGVEVIDVYWGVNLALPRSPATHPSVVTGGTLLTSVTIPEPTSTLFTMFGAILLMCFSRRK